MTDIQQGSAIVAGYDWSATVTMTADAVPFPAGVELVAHVRRKVADAAILATLSTLAQTITRISDTAITLTIPGAASAEWKPGSVFLDLVRVDADPDIHLGFRLEIPVVMPVTRGLP